MNKFMDENAFKLRIAEQTQARIVPATGLSKTQVSRVYTGESGIRLEHLGAFLQGMNLRVVPAEQAVKEIPNERLEMLDTALNMTVRKAKSTPDDSQCVSMDRAKLDMLSAMFDMVIEDD